MINLESESSKIRRKKYHSPWTDAASTTSWPIRSGQSGKPVEVKLDNTEDGHSPAWNTAAQALLASIDEDNDNEDYFDEDDEDEISQSPSQRDLVLRKLDEDTREILRGLTTPTTPRFQQTSCSHCGTVFGPGDHGFSRCADHAGVPKLPASKKLLN